MPVVPRPQEQPSDLGSSRRSTGDWRAKSSGSEWRESDRTPRPEIGSLRKTLLLTTLGFLTAGALGIFVAIVLFRPRLIPVIVATANHTKIDALGEVPYAVSQENWLRSLSLKNVAIAIPETGEPMDRLLQSMNRNEKWFDGFQARSGQASNNLPIHQGKLMGGGPGKNIVAFLIQGTLIRSKRDSDEEGEGGSLDFDWAIAHSDDNAFPNSTSPAGTKIKDLFSSLAHSLAPGCIGLVALDVQMPTIASNIADLEFPVKDIEQTFESLGPEADGLVVVLPCEQGQENWYAPELAASVFSHCFINGLESGFGDKHLTVTSFETKLKSSVCNWVEQNRDAVQLPKFLMTSSSRDFGGNYPLYRSLLTVLPNREHGNQFAVETLSNRYRELDRLWEQFGHLAPIASWDPVLFNRIQYELIALEDIAERDGKSWNRRTESVGRSLRTATERWQCPPSRVSLVECQFLQELRRSVSFTQEAMEESARPLDLDALRARSESSTDPQRDDPRRSAATVDQVTRRNDKALLLWNLLVRSAVSDDAASWKKVLSPERLDEALEWLGPSPSDSPEWIEIQQVRILANELTWQTEEQLAKVEEAVAKLIACIQMQQQNSSISLSRSNWLAYERCAWLRQEMLDCENQLLASFDNLVANRIEDSLALSLELHRDLSEVRTRAIELEQAMYYRDHIPHIVPVWLAALMRSYRSEPSNEKRLIADELASLLHRALIAEQQLAHPTSQRPNLDGNLGKDFENLQSRFYKEVQVLVADPSLQAASDPETIRLRRIALRYPYLSPALRTKYHADFVQYLAQRTNSSDGAQFGKQQFGKHSSSIPESSRQAQSPLELSDRFVQKLREVNSIGTLLYSRYCQSDPRAFPWELPPGDSQATSAREKIYPQSSAVRHLAPALALLEISGDESPWNASLRFQVLNEIEHKELQRKRLFLARWGAGEIPNANEQLYFQRLARMYAQTNSSLLSAIAQEVPKSLDESEESEEANASVQSLHALTIGSQASTNLQANLDLSSRSSLWEGAVFSLRQAQEPTTPNQEILSPEIVGAQVMNFPVNVPFRWEGNRLALRMGIRGNVVNQSVVPEKARSSTVTSFRRIVSKPTLRVVADGKIGSVVIALDCSGSMTYGAQTTAFESARRTVQNVLMHLSNMDLESQIKNDVSIMFFGISTFPFESDLLLPAREVQIQGKAVENVHATRFVRTGTERFEELQGLLLDPRLRAQGTTPLYNALSFASQMLSEKGQQESDFNRIVVISDGANEVDASQLKGFNSNATELKRTLGMSKCLVQVFQFNNIDFYKTAIDKRDPENKRRIWPDGRILEDKLKEIDQANNELLGLLQSLRPSQQRSDVFFDNFESLQTKLTESFALPRLTAVYEDGDPRNIDLVFSKTEELPGPGKLKVIVGESLDETNEVQRGLELISDEVIVLKYNNLRNQLFFNPAPLPLARAMPIVDGLRSNSEYLVDWTKTATQNWSFRVSIRKPKLAEETEYVPRPKFVVGTLTDTSGQRDSEKYLLVDHHFERSYPPVITFPDMPLRLRPQSLMRLDLWSSDELPVRAMERLRIEDGEKRTLEKTGAQLERIGKKVTVRLNSTATNRIFVLAPDAIESRRTSTLLNPSSGAVRYDEVHELEFPTDAPEIYLIDENALSNPPEDLKIVHRRIEHAL